MRAKVFLCFVVSVLLVGFSERASAAGLPGYARRFEAQETDVFNAYTVPRGGRSLLSSSDISPWVKQLESTLRSINPIASKGVRPQASVLEVNGVPQQGSEKAEPETEQMNVAETGTTRVWGPEGINDLSDLREENIILIDDEPDSDAYVAEAERLKARSADHGLKKSSRPRFVLSSRESAFESPGEAPQNGTVDIFFQGEFGYELLAVLPFAYFHFLHETLGTTRSCGDKSTALLYWFSERHTHVEGCARSDEKNDLREFKWINGLHRSAVPRQWYPPPIASHFREWGKLWNIPLYSKLVIISNKLSNEWSKGPVNIIDLTALKSIVQMYVNSGFHVIYNRAGNAIMEDEWQLSSDPSFRFDDYKVIRKMRLKEPCRSRVRLTQDIAAEHPELSFNEVQFRLMARCKCFVSVQGGNSIVSSYFGGTNIIFARRGFELDTRAFQRLYHRLSRAKIVVVRKFEHLNRRVNTMIHKYECDSI
eukprot:TRINITY_DN1095_c0_g2_i1.p1 TRINITY_DN1095_c0_g2~~TRINITY_DN1095_c0_g2_i1.p1  ORF type:complete len:480 (-),score=23.60 TRINITY_DN1095_c0_g2_i1:25-1464(-)